MSLIGALNLGQTALAANSAALQVTGNNIANAGNANYTREVATETEATDQELSPGVYVGTGVDLTGVQRQVNEALNGNLNNAISDNQAATVNQQWSGQIQSVFNALGSQNIDTDMGSFMTSWSTLANNPQDAAQRQVVIQAGQTVASDFNNLSTQIGTIQNNIGQQLNTVVGQANQLASQLAAVNTQIANSQGNGASAAPGGDNSLLDQRDSLVQQISQLVNAQAVDQGNGTVNLYVGSQPLVMAGSARGLNVVTQQINGEPVYQLQFANDNSVVNVTSGQISALIGSESQANTVSQQLDTLAANFISTVNDIHSSGQGTAGFTTVTGTNQVLDPTAALNSTAAGLNFPPKNGSFVVSVTNTSTGLSSSTLVPVNLTGSSGDTTLNSLVASLNAISGVQATVSGGMLTISSTNPNQTISFSQDSSGTLAALGINTFFQGSTAQTMSVNSFLSSNPQFLAAAQNGSPDDNSNALALAQANTATSGGTGGQSFETGYSSMINGVATTASNANSTASSTEDIVNTLTAQQQAVSGVSIDEETINLIKQQEAYAGAARIISTVDQMMQTLLAIT
ncbi:MAG: flagellar hook-associated protein FlgK [Tepidisphaeraceae bacterium]|jgi:flagellar hook-associated protein 1 FlgK